MGAFADRLEGAVGILLTMATYEYICLSCEHRFEQRRSMTASVLTEPACPSCGGDRVRRQFSFIAGRPTTSAFESGAGGCACGGACACGR